MSTEAWKIDNTHSAIQFSVRHLAIANIRGSFERWSASLALDESDLTKSSVSVEIEAASVDTANAERDGNLRSARFLDADTFPRLTFRSRRVDHAGGDRYRVVGDLTIRDITREVILATEVGGFAKDQRGNRRVGLSATTKVRRSEFGMTWNPILEAGGVAIGDEVTILIELEAIALGQQQQAA